MDQLRHVRQSRGTDCGVACVRILAGVSAACAMKAPKLEPAAIFHRTRPEQIRAALASFGVWMFREVHCEDWSKIPQRVNRALLVVNYDDVKDTWHWVVFDRADPKTPILDPQSKNRRSVHRSTRLFSYYRVESA